MQVEEIRIVTRGGGGELPRQGEHFLEEEKGEEKLPSKEVLEKG